MHATIPQVSTGPRGIVAASDRSSRTGVRLARPDPESEALFAMAALRRQPDRMATSWTSERGSSRLSAPAADLPSVSAALVVDGIGALSTVAAHPHHAPTKPQREWVIMRRQTT